MDSLINTIKEVTTPTYSVILIEVNGGYKVMSHFNDSVSESSILMDYSMASFIFDNKTQESEGN